MCMEVNRKKLIWEVLSEVRRRREVLGKERRPTRQLPR